MCRRVGKAFFWEGEGGRRRLLPGICVRFYFRVIGYFFNGYYRNNRKMHDPDQRYKVVRGQGIHSNTTKYSGCTDLRGTRKYGRVT